MLNIKITTTKYMYVNVPESLNQKKYKLLYVLSKQLSKSIYVWMVCFDITTQSSSMIVQ